MENSDESWELQEESENVVEPHYVCKTDLSPVCSQIRIDLLLQSDLFSQFDLQRGPRVCRFATMAQGRWKNNSIFYIRGSWHGESKVSIDQVNDAVACWVIHVGFWLPNPSPEKKDNDDGD